MGLCFLVKEVFMNIPPAPVSSRILVMMDLFPDALLHNMGVVIVIDCNPILATSTLEM